MIRPREIAGRLERHPPEFWVLERSLSPSRDLAISCVWLNFSTVLKEDVENECIRVKRNWRRAKELNHFYPWTAISSHGSVTSNRQVGTVVCNGLAPQKALDEWRVVENPTPEQMREADENPESLDWNQLAILEMLESMAAASYRQTGDDLDGSDLDHEKGDADNEDLYRR